MSKSSNDGHYEVFWPRSPRRVTRKSLSRITACLAIWSANASHFPGAGTHGAPKAIELLNRNFLLAAKFAGALVAMTYTTPGVAQGWPERPVRIVNP